MSFFKLVFLSRLFPLHPPLLLPASSTSSYHASTMSSSYSSTSSSSTTFLFPLLLPPPLHYPWLLPLLHSPPTSLLQLTPLLPPQSQSFPDPASSSIIPIGVTVLVDYTDAVNNRCHSLFLLLLISNVVEVNNPIQLSNVPELVH